jgi:hypothetical protein
MDGFNTNPERDHTPSLQPFNVAAMTPGQLIFLNAALEERSSRMIAAGYEDGDTWKDAQEVDQLMNMLGAGLEGSADTEHGRDLFRALIEDDDKHSQFMAGHAAAAFAPHDYELARDAALKAYYQFGGLDELDTFAKRLTPEQRADFEAAKVRWQASSPWA